MHSSGDYSELVAARTLFDRVTSHKANLQIPPIADQLFDRYLDQMV